MLDAATKTNWLLARPEVDEAEVQQLAQRAFGVSGRLRELGSQQDRNFLIENATGTSALFKVNHPSVSEDTIALQAAVSDRLRERGLATPEILRTADGARSVPIDVDGSDPARACAFALVAGDTLADVAAMDGALAEELGALVGRTVRALEDFTHPHADREIQWELTHASEVVEWLVEDLPEDRRQQCSDATAAAAAHLDALSDLPRQIIHGDLTSDNIMRDAAGTHWIVDLGDTARSWRVAELAVLAADVIGRTGDLTLVNRAVRGFASEVTLTDDEIEAIWPLVVLRGAVLAVSGWSQLSIDPDNAYARERIEHEWEVFAQAAAVDHAEVVAQLRLAAGRPHTRDAAYAPLLADIARSVTLDLGVRSERLDRGRWTAPGVEIELAREALAGAPVAVARFGESRLSRVSCELDAPAATKSRCVELWSRPGVAVHAPFAGDLVQGFGFVELSDAGITLRLEGVDTPIASTQTHVVSGTVIGRVAPTAPGLGRLRVSRRVLGAEAAPLFGAPGDEYETAGAADPSAIIGTEPVADPIRELRHERQRRDHAMGGAAERYYAHPPQIERGWNTLLIDTEGRAYLDLVNNVTAIGHAHPRLADAVGRQLNLLNTNSRFLYEAFADFSDKLLAHAPDPSLDTVIPVNSGSEAVDLAIRLAQVATGRTAVIATREAYHGWTMASDAVSTSAFDNPAALASRPDWVHLVDAPNAYRGPFRGADAGVRYAAQVAEVAAQLSDADRGPAAFICETVLGNAGGVIPPEGYLAGAYDAVRAAGGLVIADEVQVGYGRLGEAFFGATMQGVVPDIIAVAKAAGNAYPVGAVITKRWIVDAMRREGMFFSSAGGAPASAVAGSVVLDVIREEQLQENARVVGAHLSEALSRLATRHALIGPVHGRGLYLGVELIRDHDERTPAVEETAWICERLLDHGIIMQATSERQNVLKVKPPMTLTIAEADVFVDALDRTLRELDEKRGSTMTS
ncbi:aminotransferase [Leucobacter tardus]|uniref:Aminotransferase n=1 Tax=Leucobacter tardus TaxID=501483 RepID=A0A939TQC5_9MICO|nr:aminotransferase [Leucobacter tardus]MBO2988812.1 aminotransferase [Leucobacter tardus]